MPCIVCVLVFPSTTMFIIQNDIEPGDVTITSQCGHVFHRECIMGWLLHHDKVGDRGGGSRVNTNSQGNDECPHCRQLMWDINAYQLVEAQQRATWNHSKEMM